MAEEEKKGSNFSLPNASLLALTVAIFGLALYTPSPFIEERPPGQLESDVPRQAILDVDARLWEDPLSAVVKFMRAKRQCNETSARTSADTVDGAFAQENSITRVLVLAVMIPGGPYPEQEEMRRRDRYAVLSALATQNFAPDETEHIGYFIANLKKEEEKKTDEITACQSGSFPVPFELFSQIGSTAREPSNQGVIVLWLDDSRFDHDIQHEISEIVRAINSTKKLTYAVIGPNISSQLETMAEEAEQYMDPEITFYAAGATASRHYLRAQGAKPPENVIRTIATDDVVSLALVEELEKRHIYPHRDHVLLISEWDTLYGRLLPDTFAHAYGDEKCHPLETAAGEAPAAHVYCMNYMRGIDGLLPRDPEKPASGQEENRREILQLNVNIDRPSGNNQKDYLRRVVEQVRTMDRQIGESEWPSPVRNNGIAAIGVLGSDVYDKLMILQALRPYFPGKLFFTTDLDAAYFTPREQPYTHNLIVGSGYGLTLAPELQKYIPPFRDSYQTAIFLSVKLAIANWPEGEGGKVDAERIKSKVRGWLKDARVFEIGRTGPVDLSPAPRQSAVTLGDGTCAKSILSCTSIHPDHAPGRGIHVSYALALKAAALTLGLLLLSRISLTSRRLFESESLRARFKTASLRGELASMLPIAAVLLPAGIIYLAVIATDEPFYWLNGVSIWPSNLLQLAALALAIWSLRKISQMIKKGDADIVERFLRASDAAPVSPSDSPLDVLAVHKWELALAPNGTIDVRRLWREYQTYTAHRNTRALINTFIAVLFGFTAVMLSGGLPVPARGNAFYSDVVLEILCVFAVVFLIMWEVDTARLASRFIEHIANELQTGWPGIKDPKWGWPQVKDEDLACWIDVQFVAQYTGGMDKFIWFPIFPMLLLGIARISIFDDWTFSPGLLVAIALLLCYLFSIAFLFQHDAKVMRNKALERLDESLRKMRSEPATFREEIIQLEKMIAEVKANEEGAFTPFLRQPMVQALLATLSGSGGIAMLLQRPFF